MKFSIRGLALLVTAATVVSWLLIVQPWREERFRPYSEYQHELNSQQLRRELGAGEGQSEVGRYIRKIGDRWSCLAIGSQRWNFEAGPVNFTYTYGTMRRQGAVIELKKHWASDDVPERVVVVAWGPRYYLLLENEIEAFRNAVETGAEPRKTLEGDFFMMDGDESKATSGLPDLPR